MNFLAALQTYFDGETWTGYGLMAAGAAALLFALALYKSQSGGFLWAGAVPLLLYGLGGLGGGAGLALRTAKQVPALQQAYRQDPQAMVAQELPRMERVNANWPRVKTTWTVIIAVSLILIWAGAGTWMSALGVSLILICASLLTVDVYAERRAVPYTQALMRIAAPR